MVGLMEEFLFIGYFSSVLICSCINIPFYVDRNITNIPFGILLIAFPVINLIYSGYIVIKYSNNDIYKFF